MMIKRTSLFAFLSIFLVLNFVALGQEGTSRRDATRQCRALLKKATKFIKAQQSDSALIMLDSIFIIDDTNPDAYFFKGKLLAGDGDTSSAIEILAEGLDKGTRSTRLKLLLAQLKIAKQDLESADSLLNQVLAIKPNQSEALYFKGNILLLRGDTAAAIPLYEKGLNHIQKKK